jgi:hypothetical protein
MPPEGASPEKLPDSMWTLLYKWITARPSWLQNTALLIVAIAIATGVGTYTYIKLKGLEGSSSNPATPGPAATPAATPAPLPPVVQQGPVGSAGSYGQGTPRNPPAGTGASDPELDLAAMKRAQDAEHYEWHQKHPEDPQSPEKEPQWQVVSRDSHNYVLMRFYGATDRCLVVRRMVQDRVMDLQWLKDPGFKDGRPLTSPVADLRRGGRRSLAALSGPMGASLAFLAPPYGSLAHDPAPSPALKPEAVQGLCANPHPGNFTWWWGPPADQCWSPMYRRFGDGCTHYQLYNRCANAWDGRIFWVACTPGARGHF